MQEGLWDKCFVIIRFMVFHLKRLATHEARDCSHMFPSGVTMGWHGGARVPPTEDGAPPSASPFEILKLEKKLQNQIQLLFLLMKHIYF